MSENGNSAAFPIEAEAEKRTAQDGWGSAGLTKREYFAGLAMQGMNANPQFTGNTASERAKFAVVEADALLAELAKATP